MRSNLPTFLVGSDWRIVSIDPQVADWLGTSVPNATGQLCYEAVNAHNLDDSPFCRPECPLLAAFADKEIVDAVVRLGPCSHKELRVKVHYAIFDRSLRILHSMAAVEEQESFHSILTRRQSDIIAKLERGFSHGQIAEQCHIAASTVETHLKRMRYMLDCHSDRELVTWYREHK